MAHRVHLFTFKTGLLSRVAHDLRLRVERVEIDTADGELRARFEVDSIRVDGVMREQQLDTQALGARDQAKIVATIQADILDARRHPTITYRGRLDRERLAVDGELELAGTTRRLRVDARRVGERVHASVELRPSHYGIAPYKALAGAIKLQDRVRVELDLDAAQLGLSDPGSAADETPPGP